MSKTLAIRLYLYSTEVENQEWLLPVSGVPSGRARPRRRAKIVLELQ